jgi:pimeloyl-ACP methyl ester carboxylesterase
MNHPGVSQVAPAGDVSVAVREADAAGALSQIRGGNPMGRDSALSFSGIIDTAVQPCSRAVEVEGRVVRLTEWAAERAETIVAWHGLGADPAIYFDEVGPRLARAGFRVVAVEAPPEPALEQLTALACKLLRRLCSRPATFVGSSWGAVVGLRLAAVCPERLSGLVLVDGGYREPSDALPRALRRPRFLARAALRAVTRHESEALREAASTSPASTYGALSDSRLPVLLLAASGSGGLERIRDAVPQLRVVELDTGHDLLAESPGRVAAEIRAWLG